MCIKISPFTVLLSPIFETKIVIIVIEPIGKGNITKMKGDEVGGQVGGVAFLRGENSFSQFQAELQVL